MYEHENSPEADLIRLEKRGDVKAFSRLYAGIYTELYRFALYTMKHPQDAEDAVSETVIAAYESIRNLKKEESFKKWMFTILANKCRKALARRLEEQKKLTDREVEDEKGENAFICARKHDPDYAQQYAVKEAFESLGEEERMIVAFSVFGGYHSEEIGAILEKSAATIRSRKSRALEKMRRRLDADM